ncbi:MAG: cell division protein ZapD [Gammaproteobacteria bacterium]
MSDPIVYEQPLNERMRTLLRLEHLFNQTNHALKANSSWDHRQAIAGIIEILSLLERADLKTEFMKEIDRMSAVLNKLKQQPDVDQQALDKLLTTLREHHYTLQHTTGRLGDALRTNELVNVVRQRLAIPGGTCGFDLPAFHFWLSQTMHTRKESLENWYRQFGPIESTVSLLLDIVRQSAYEEKVHAPGGYFQKALETNTPCQLVRVTLHGVSSFPEISGGKHRISIRFLTQDDHLHPVPRQDDVHFTLGCCVI